MVAVVGAARKSTRWCCWIHRKHRYESLRFLSESTGLPHISVTIQGSEASTLVSKANRLELQNGAKIDSASAAWQAEVEGMTLTGENNCQRARLRPIRVPEGELGENDRKDTLLPRGK